MATSGSESTEPAVLPTARGARRSEWVDRLLAAARRRGGLSSHFAIAGVLAIILAICLRMGLMPLRSYVEDTVFFADNAWRVLWGQRPYTDYSSGLGPVTYLISALGLKLSGGRLDGLVYGNAVAGVALGVWAYALLWRRVCGWTAVIGSALLCLLALAPVQLGESFRLSTIAMSYNRQGYAMLGLLIIEAFPLAGDRQERSFAGAVSTGALCGIMLFLKANYFLVSLVLAAVSLIWTGRVERRRVLGVAAGFAITALAFMAYQRFDLASMLSDLRQAADARSGAVPTAFVAQVFLENLPSLVILSGLAAVIQFAAGGVSGLWRYRVWALIAMVYGAGVLLLVTNAQLERLPLQELLALLFLDCLVRKGMPDPRHVLAFCAVGIGFIVGPASADPMSLLNGLRLKLRPPGEWAYPLTAGKFAGVLFVDDYLDNKGSHRAFGRFLAQYLNEGVELLRRERREGEKVITMDTYNGFPYALGIEPPHGGMASATYKYLYSDRFHPTVDAFFGNADVVMFPKEHCLEDKKWEGLMIYYYPEMERRYTVAAESGLWKMYRKKK